MTYCCSPTDPMDCDERATCAEAGQPGHTSCGTCEVHARPIHRCGCSRVVEQPGDWADAIMEAFNRMTPEEQESHLAQQFAELEALFTSGETFVQRFEREACE